jgi:methyl-accepting chemotaxis protein
MRHINITAKIWLSIGVFVLGFVFSTILGQVQGLNTEGTLRATSEELFPAAQLSQDAESTFQRAVQGFSDAVIVQDASGLERATEEGRRTVERLNALAAIRGLAAVRTGDAGKVAASVERFLEDARATYGMLLANPANTTLETQERTRELASRTGSIKNLLHGLKEQFSQDLHDRLSGIQRRSEQQRRLALIVFCTTLAISAVIVNLTIRRCITGPIVRVIHGVQGAVDEAAQASNQMASSGRLVARGAQEQSASLEETSAALEGISATTRENANRATQADRLMNAAGQTVDRATQAMNNLTQSMEVISKSSTQVAGALKRIDEIAFYTNILALNAAVEAARAGQAGAGFSAVADEVRSLAKRAAEAARFSAEIVGQTIADVGNGVKLVALAHSTFHEVSATIACGSEMVSQIAASSEEQASGINRIGEAVSRMETVTQNNAAHAEQTAESASSMTIQVQRTRKHLDELVAVVGLRLR